MWIKAIAGWVKGIAAGSKEMVYYRETANAKRETGRCLSLKLNRER
jgi:hypothetical protein